MARNVLGRGINALLGSDSPAEGGEELLDLDVDLIDANSDQPRSRFSDTDLEELAQSIRVNGIVQPIIVRRHAGRFQIVAGERRWRAAQRVGLTKIPAVLKEVSDDKVLEIALIENIQRQELNPIEEARAYRKLIENLGLTQENVAERVGKHRTVITTSLRLLNLPDDVLVLLEEKKISAGHGRALLTVEGTDGQRQLARDIIDKRLSVRETEKAAKKVGRPASGGKEKTPQKVDPNIKAAESKLRRYLSTSVQIIPDGKGTGGRIEIDYFGTMDLDRIYNAILKGK